VSYLFTVEIIFYQVKLSIYYTVQTTDITFASENEMCNKYI
jgi:hypothetical protein